MTGRPMLIVADDADHAAELATNRIEAAMRRAIEQRGTFGLALSGGSGVLPLLGELARRTLPWSQARVFQVDERVAIDGSPDRNATALERILVEGARTGPVHASLLDVVAADLDDAAARYAAELASFGPLDLVHLGLGEDGHTASWPPGTDLDELAQRDVAVVGPFNGFRRLTLTPGVIDRAESVLFFVTGASKAGVLRRLLEGDESMPASRVPRTNALVVADRAAAAEIT